LLGNGRKEWQWVSLKNESVAPQAIRNRTLPIRSSIAKMAIESISQHMSESKRPRPRDPNQLAKLMMDIATGEKVDPLVTDDGRDLAAVLLGRKGGLKGGKARAKALSPERRAEIARAAAQARWSTDGE
jgi:hypothetical protein